jgi:molybdopterin converting factor small subunit
VPLRAGDTVKVFLKRADGALGLKKNKPFRRVFKQGVRPVVLLNGDRIELPQENTRHLADGDEVSIILSMAGG